MYTKILRRSDMAVDPIKTTGVSLSGNNGETIKSPQTKEQEKLARAIANLDNREALSATDIEKLKKMPPEEQIKYLNNALKGTGYQIAQVYDAAEGENTPGVSFNSNGVFINYSKGGKTIYHNSPDNGHLSITYKK